MIRSNQRSHESELDRREKNVTHLSQEALVLLHGSILELDSGRLDHLLFLLFLVILDFGDGGLTTSFTVSLQARLDDGLDEVIGSEDLASLGVFDHPVGESRASSSCQLADPG